MCHLISQLTIALTLLSSHKNGNKVPKTDGAKPMMELSDTVPDDLDYQYYIDEAQTILEGLGI